MTEPALRTLARLRAIFAKDRVAVIVLRAGTEPVAEAIPDFGRATVGPPDLVEVTRPAEADIAIVQANGPDHSLLHLKLRALGFNGVLVSWLLDNHLADLDNLKTAMTADVYVPAHAFHADYLLNMASIRAPAVPWGLSVPASRLAELAEDPAGGRADRVFGAFFAYDWSPRRPLLARLKAADGVFAITLNRHGDPASPIAAMSLRQMEEQWAGYKASVAVPVTHDFSPRILNGLAAGHVVLVSDGVKDLDRIIPPALQAELGILRFDPEAPTDALEAVGRRAIAAYDAGGAAAVRRRNRHVVAHHTKWQRVRAILGALDRMADGRFPVVRRPAGLAAQGADSDTFHAWAGGVDEPDDPGARG